MFSKPSRYSPHHLPAEHSFDSKDSDLFFTEPQNSLSWKQPTRIIEFKSWVNGPYRDWTHNTVIISTLLSWATLTNRLSSSGKKWPLSKQQNSKPNPNQKPTNKLKRKQQKSLKLWKCSLDKSTRALPKNKRLFRGTLQVPSFPKQL